MKIGISANTSWNIVNFRLELMKDLRNMGFEVVVIAPRDQSTERILREGFQYEQIKNLERKGSNPYKDFKLKEEYKRIYKEQEFDIVLLYTIKSVIYGNLAKKNLSLQSISTITGLGYAFINKGIRPMIAKKLYKAALRFSEHIFFQNVDDKILFEKIGIINKERSRIINGSGINTALIKPSTYSSKGNHLKFLFVGRILVDKGIKELLTAFHDLAPFYDIELLIVGSLDKDNPSVLKEDEFANLINIPPISYLGQRNDVINIMQEVDVVILPSYREGVPRVLLEAMALARPIITTNVPGCREVIIHSESGFICESKSVSDLKDKMELMINLTSEERIQMGKNGRRLSEEKFDQKIISQKYIDLLKEMKYQQRTR